jgi:hypothetical protein
MFWVSWPSSHRYTPTFIKKNFWLLVCYILDCSIYVLVS